MGAGRLAVVFGKRFGAVDLRRCSGKIEFQQKLW